MSALLLPYPRRTRRRLLLPPGLLALAWLLWLGCVAVPQLRGGARMHLVALLVPGPLKFGWHTNLLQHRIDEGIHELSIARQVQTVPSSTWLRYFYEQQLHFSLPQNTQGATWQGVAFHFDGAPSYGGASLLASLERQSDILYWFVNAPAGGTAYAFRMPPANFVENVGYIADPCMCHDVMPFQEPMTLIRVKDIIVSDIAFYLAPEWRNTWLLLLLLATLSTWKLRRQWWVEA
ncbi:hypothetical protein KLP40_11690 [Hymenobacter sp. NST-14]|uniref:hypothetical protein n=1 Tax=Hymenobacter piscis TaxID=2839984 RepID=UPI001C0305D3|nr:hypothetical protein [Hymenobacter piscis]MBT9393825.1 hypothetical protein [Hymenobacter piscis]